MGLVIQHFYTGASAYKDTETGDLICRSCMDEDNERKVLQSIPGQWVSTVLHCDKGHFIQVK